MQIQLRSTHTTLWWLQKFECSKGGPHTHTRAVVNSICADATWKQLNNSTHTHTYKKKPHSRVGKAAQIPLVAKFTARLLTSRHKVCVLHTFRAVKSRRCGRLYSAKIHLQMIHRGFWPSNCWRKFARRNADANIRFNVAHCQICVKQLLSHPAG